MYIQTFKNLDSDLCAIYDIPIITNCASLLPCIGRPLAVYLVKGETMDLLYPPRRRRLLEPDRVAENFGKIREDRDRLDNPRDVLRALLSFWEGIEPRETGSFLPMGLYLPQPPGHLDLICQEYADSIQDFIFLCPERIAQSAERHGLSFDLLFNKVLAHEVAHAAMKGDHEFKDEPWGRVIEESLAEAFSLLALQPFADELERERLFWFSQSLPLEYKSCRFWLPPKILKKDLSKAPAEKLELVAKMWRKGTVDLGEAINLRGTISTVASHVLFITPELAQPLNTINKIAPTFFFSSVLNFLCCQPEWGSYVLRDEHSQDYWKTLASLALLHTVEAQEVSKTPRR